MQHDLRLRYSDILSAFVSDVPEASRIIRRTRTAVSGSQVLQFMDPSNVFWKNTAKDLDLYTTEEHFVDLIGFFVSKESYYVHNSSHELLEQPVIPEGGPEEDELDEEVAMCEEALRHTWTNFGRGQMMTFGGPRRVT